MNTKHAIGISINGNNVKAAFLSRINGEIHIMGLQSTTLAGPVEYSRQFQEQAAVVDDEDVENAFDINESIGKNIDEEEEMKATKKDTNVSIIYSLMDKFQDTDTLVGINSPILTVKYDFLDNDSIPKEKDKKSLSELWGKNSNGHKSSEFIKVSSEKSLRVEYEHHPPILDLIDEVNQFRRGQLKLQLLDTNELALTHLVRKSYRLRKEYTTAVIYIEPDFSRVIFLRGDHIHYITPIIHKGSMSRDVLDVIYSKIILAQDHHHIPELDKIVMASRSAKLEAKQYFQEKFPSSTIGYVNSALFKSQYNFDEDGRLFSQYAIPISFAWKLLQKKSKFSKTTNLLPEYIKERQTMPKLAFHGYILLFLLAITTFTFTWQLITKKIELSKINNANEMVVVQITDNQPLADRVKFYEEEILKIENNLSLLDSMTVGYDEPINFLHKLNKSAAKSGIWVSKLSLKENRVQIDGVATQRDKIPTFSNTLGGANLISNVTRSDFLSRKVFSFRMDKDIQAEENKQNLKFFSSLKKKIGNVIESTNGKSTNGNSTNGNSTNGHQLSSKE